MKGNFAELYVPYVDIAGDCDLTSFGTISRLTIRARVLEPNIEVYGWIELGAAPPVGQLTITLPDYLQQVPTAGAEVQFGAAWYLDNGTRHYPGVVRHHNDTELEFIHPEPANSGLVSNAAPFAMVAGDQIGWNISYEHV